MSSAQELMMWLEDTVQMAPIPPPPGQLLTQCLFLCVHWAESSALLWVPRKKSTSALLQFPQGAEEEEHFTSQSK